MLNKGIFKKAGNQFFYLFLRSPNQILFPMSFSYQAELINFVIFIWLKALYKYLSHSPLATEMIFFPFSHFFGFLWMVMT